MAVHLPWNLDQNVKKYKKRICVLFFMGSCSHVVIIFYNTLFEQHGPALLLHRCLLVREKL